MAPLSDFSRCVSFIAFPLHWKPYNERSALNPVMVSPLISGSYHTASGYPVLCESLPVITKQAIKKRFLPVKIIRPG